MIIVTGAAGFIGSCIVARLNELGRQDIILVDEFDSQLKEANLKGKKFIQPRYNKQEFLNLVLRDQITFPVDYLIHMGACSSTTLTDAKYFEENNFLYTKHLAVWALKHHVRFIYASSAATYGDGSCGYKDDEQTTRRVKPLNLYGQSKQKFDQWVLEQGLINKMAGLKFFNVFGPNEYHKGDMRSVVCKTYSTVLSEGKIKLFKSHRKDYVDGEQKRDFIYVKDAVDVVMFFIEHPEICGIFNVGTGEARSWNDLANALFKAIGRAPHIEYFDMPDSLKDKYQYFTQADMTNLRAKGYKKSFTKLEEAIAEYVSYLREEKCW